MQYGFLILLICIGFNKFYSIEGHTTERNNTMNLTLAHAQWNGLKLPKMKKKTLRCLVKIVFSVKNVIDTINAPNSGLI